MWSSSKCENPAQLTGATSKGATRKEFPRCAQCTPYQVPHVKFTTTCWSSHAGPQLWDRGVPIILPAPAPSQIHQKLVLILLQQTRTDYQGIGTGNKGIKKQRVVGAETFRVIWYEDVTVERRNEVTYTKLVCKLLPQKEDPNRNRIIIDGNIIIFPGDGATPTDSLKLTKIIINFFISLHGVKFACFNVKLLSCHPDGQIRICQNQYYWYPDGL